MKHSLRIISIAILILISILCLSCKGHTVKGIHDLHVISSMQDDSLSILFSLDDMELSDCKAEVQLEKPDGMMKRYRRLLIKGTGNEYSVRVPLKRKRLWSPDSPKLYKIKLIIDQGEHRYIGSQRFGIRDLETKNGKFYLNGKPIYVRAYGGEGGCGCDDLSKEAVRKRLSQAKAYGFNAVRHHSHIPKDSYMAIADEVGILVQMEIKAYKIGKDPHSEAFQEWAAIWQDMIKMGRKHPATFIYGCGNEIYRNDPGLVAVLDSLYDIAKDLDPGTLVLNRSGSNPFNDAFGKFDLIERPIGEYEHRAEYANEAFEAYLRGSRKGRTDEFSIIAHEYPLVASYPNPELIDKYDSIPYWIDTTITMAKKNGLEHLLPDFVKNTETIQNIVRKEMLEEARKFPELDGYSMLRFTDCGAYVSGVVDDFADPKNVSAQEFLQTNGETVLLCSWNERILTNEDTLKLTLHCSHHGGEAMRFSEGEWSLGREEEGKIGGFIVQAVDVADIAEINIPLNKIKTAKKLTLKAFAGRGNNKIKNQWSFWVFPKVEKLKADHVKIWDPRDRMDELANIVTNAHYANDLDRLNINETDLILSDSWDESFYSHLDEGGDIWILSGKTWAWPEEMGIFGLHIARIDPAYQSPALFPQLDEPLTNWLTVCSNHPKRFGNSGTMINEHPALGNFPHDGFCDMHFWPMIYRAKSLRLKDFPDGTEPMIRAIDNFYRGESKGYLVEMQVGKGRLLISTLNLIQHLDYSASTRYMFKELFEHMKGEYDAQVKMTTAELREMIDSYAKEVADNPPRVHSEMAARYENLWARRLAPEEVIYCYPYDAKEALAEEMDVHYEYAQTQWYYKVAPGKILNWDFKNYAAGVYELYLYTAGVFPENKVELKIDDLEVRKLKLEYSGSWQKFTKSTVNIGYLESGEHSLKIKIPETNQHEDGLVFLLREVEMREIMDNENQ